MNHLANGHARRAALSTIVVGVLLLAGLASPAAAVPRAVGSAAPAASQAAPGPDVDRHTDTGTQATQSALAITEPTLKSSRSVEGNNVEAEMGQISGHVNDSEGNSLSGVLVSVWSSDWDGVTAWDYPLTLVETVETGEAGYFTLDVPVGYYTLFYNPVDEPDSAWSWVGGSAFPPGNPTLVTTEGWQAPAILGEPQSISGSLTGGPTGTPLSAPAVTLWAGHERDLGQWWFQPVWDIASGSGGFGFSQLPGGHYLVEVVSPSTAYRGEWWSNKFSFATSDIISIFNGENFAANVNLSQYAQVLPPLAVAGIPAVGNTVTITVPTKVTGATYNYDWYADGVAIAGSAGKTSFTITAAQQGKQLSSKVTVAKTGYLTASLTTPRTTRVIAHSAPTITGPIAVGYTLTANPNAWTPGTTFTYQWYANGVAITGATAAKYKLAVAERDKNITVRARGSNPGYTTVSRGSVATAKVAQVAKPVITGTPKVGQRLTAATSGWTPSTVFTFRWYANGVAISGAVSRTLTLTTAQVGKAITVRATGSKTGYITYTQTSLPTALVVR